jgi:hypothetical protein
MRRILAVKHAYGVLAILLTLGGCDGKSPTEPDVSLATPNPTPTPTPSVNPTPGPTPPPHHAPPPAPVPTPTPVPTSAKIDVRGKGISIVSGDATPSTADDTDFGATPSGTPLTHTFTIASTGTANVTIGAVSVPTGFTATALPASPVTAGSTTTLSVRCDATSVGSFSGMVSIANNDPHGNPYTFALACQVNAFVPKIDVRGKGISIVSGDATPGAADDTDFGATPAGTPVSHTFTIASTGTANLTIGAVSVPTGFTVTALPTTPVMPAGTVTLTIRCDAATASTSSGTVSIVNNDSSKNPYSFAITCLVQPLVSDIDVRGNGISITSGDGTPSAADATDFGGTPVGTAVSHTFTIANTGTADLTLGVVSVPTGFTVTALPRTLLKPAGTTTLTIRCDAATTGTPSGTVSIVNDDSSKNPYSFAITCLVQPLVPDIDVRGNGISIPSGDVTPRAADATDFGVTPLGIPVTHTFTIANTGTANVVLTDINIPGDYGFSSLSSSTVTPGGTETLGLICPATAAGTHTGTVTIRSNDPDENPYTFVITCLVQPLVPDIDVRGNGISIPSGDGTPSPADATDFGVTPVGSPVTHTFTIANTGAASLVLTDINIPGDYGFSSLSSSTVTPGGTETLGLICPATAAGTHAGTVTIRSNDPDENPYSFALTCVVTP